MFRKGASAATARDATSKSVGSARTIIHRSRKRGIPEACFHGADSCWLLQYCWPGIPMGLPALRCSLALVTFRCRRSSPGAAPFHPLLYCDSRAARGRQAILHGQFPHLGAGGPGLTDVLKSVVILDGDRSIHPSDDALLVFARARASDDETWFDKSTRVPLQFFWPRRIAAAEFDLLASTVDIMPTILGLCGVPAPDGLQGVDLSPWLLRGSGARPNRSMRKAASAPGNPGE